MNRRVETSDDSPKRFNWFGGVFTPNVLTILGVIMFLRLGWVVGNAGFLGAVAIILLSKSVTLCTGLSMASLTTNINIGHGGAYSIISKSLGLEAGGSVGIPFYVSMVLSAALYIIGFTEGWLWLFPDHPPQLVFTLVWLVLLVISYTSADFAIRIQFFILAMIALSILSFVFTPASPDAAFKVVGEFREATFWETFAIFFPAVTGIMAGANLSGELKDPRRAIPLGTISSILVTLGIYLGLAWFCTRTFSARELMENQMVMVDYAIWSPIVVAGILAATFSSALGSMLGAPRVLMALADQRTVPAPKFFSKRSRNHEPRNAIVVTGAGILAALFLGDLDALASLITMFFLITYGVLNIIVFLQQQMKIVSFRPQFAIPRFVPLLGGVGCLAIMFLIDPVFSVVALVVIVVIYIWLTRKGLDADWGDIRGGMFLLLSERLSKIADRYPRHQITWKPDLLLPIDNPRVWAGPLKFIRDVTYPSGSIFAFSVQEEATEDKERELDELLAPLREQDVVFHAAVLEDKDFLHATRLVIQVLKVGSLRPNTLFLTVGDDSSNDEIIDRLFNICAERELGVILLRQHPKMAFGMQETVNLWLRDLSPNWHLAILVALQLQNNWDGRINIVTSVPEDVDHAEIREFHEHLSDQARLPADTGFHILTGDFEANMGLAPRADINIFGLGDTLDFDAIRKAPGITHSSCLYIKDSGLESALV